MLNFISLKEAADKWNIPQKKLAVLCAEKMINGAILVGKNWIIPSNAEKPATQNLFINTDTVMNSAKPFVKWVGGKSQLVNEIEKKFFIEKPVRFTKYAEPMVGGGAILFDLISKYDFGEVYISDTNRELINCYFVIKNNVEELIDKLNDFQLTFLPMDNNGRKYYFYTIREKFNSTELNDNTATEKAAEFIFLNKTCFNGLYRVNSKGQFNVPMGSYKNPTICDDTNLRTINETLKNVTIVCGDYTLSKSFIDCNTFVYIDPPYRPISETSGFTSYTSAAFDDNEQIRLAEFINEINETGAKIVLSNSDPKNNKVDDNFFDDLYKSYNIERVEAVRAINSKGDRRGKIKELIISN